MSDELKNCPAGHNSERVIGGPGTAGGPKYWAGCDYCNWRTWGDTVEEAIAAWNLRIPSSNEALLREALDMTPAGALGLPRWKYELRMAAAVLEIVEMPLTNEARLNAAQVLCRLQTVIDAVLNTVDER